MKKAVILLIGLILAFCIFISIPIFIRAECSLLPWPVETKLGLPWKKIPCSYTGIMWGKSALEYGRDIKCIIDKQGFCFLFGSCKLTTCPVNQAPQTDNGGIRQLIRNGCVSYFDGCNGCSVDENGATMCTEIFCETYQQPRCLEYKRN